MSKASLNLSRLYFKVHLLHIDFSLCLFFSPSIKIKSSERTSRDSERLFLSQTSVLWHPSANSAFQILEQIKD